MMSRTCGSILGSVFGSAFGFASGLTLGLSLVTSIAFAKKVKEKDAFPLERMSQMDALEARKMASVKSEISGHSGKVVLVDFWASWCGPCKQALPAYNKLYSKFKKDGFSVVGINVDDEKSAGVKFLQEHPVNFPIVYDSGKKLVSEVGVVTMPTSYLVDSKGNVHEVHQGFREGDESKMARDIAGLLKKK